MSELPFIPNTLNCRKGTTARLKRMLLLRLPLFAPLTVLGLQEPKQVSALPDPGKADFYLGALAQEIM